MRSNGLAEELSSLPLASAQKEAQSGLSAFRAAPSHENFAAHARAEFLATDRESVYGVSEQDIVHRQEIVLPILQNQVDITGDIFGNVREGTKLTFEIEKFDLYTNGRPRILRETNPHSGERDGPYMHDKVTGALLYEDLGAGPGKRKYPETRQETKDVCEELRQIATDVRQAYTKSVTNMAKAITRDVDPSAVGLADLDDGVEKENAKWKDYDSRKAAGLPPKTKEGEIPESGEAASSASGEDDDDVDGLKAVPKAHTHLGETLDARRQKQESEESSRAAKYQKKSDKEYSLKKEMARQDAELARMDAEEKEKENKNAAKRTREDVKLKTDDSASSEDGEIVTVQHKKLKRSSRMQSSQEWRDELTTTMATHHKKEALKHLQKLLSVNSTLTREDSSLTSLLGEVIHKLGGEAPSVATATPSATTTSESQVDENKDSDASSVPMSVSETEAVATTSVPPVASKSTSSKSTISTTVTPSGEVELETVTAPRDAHSDSYGSSLDGPRIFDDERYHQHDPIFA